MHIVLVDTVSADVSVLQTVCRSTIVAPALIQCTYMDSNTKPLPSHLRMILNLANVGKSLGLSKHECVCTVSASNIDIHMTHISTRPILNSTSTRPLNPTLVWETTTGDW